jgi:uncharacterized membrane protein
MDLNGDGNADIAALELFHSLTEPYTLDVLLGDGSGHFATQKRSPVMDASLSVGDYAFGDFRGTGRPDFVATAGYFSASPYLAFAKNNGDATFTALPLTHPSGAQGIIGMGDFNGDGKLDLLVVGQGVRLFLGNGDGTFTPGYTAPFNLPSGYYPDQVFIGDFNGDHKLDALVRITNNIVGRLGDNVYEFLGKGDGTFSAPTVVIPNCGVIAVGDLNKDGRPDVVESSQPLTSDSLRITPVYNVYLAQPDGSFNLTNTYQPYAGLNPSFVPTLADINGDGNLDIPVFQFYPVSGNLESSWVYLQVLLGNGDGTFTPSYTTYDFHLGWVPQYLADVNGDGKADLIELDGYTASAHVIPATSGPALQARLVSYPIVGSQGTVRINLALASSSATTIQLSASDSALTIPGAVTIPAGTASLDVPFKIGSNFNPNHVFTIIAALATQTAVAYGWKANPANPAGFRLILNYHSEGIAPSQTTPDYGVYVNTVSGYATTVQLSCSGLPSWAACQFGTPTMEMPPGTLAQSTLVVTTTSAASDGDYNFNVIATDGTITNQVAATLQVQGVAPPPGLTTSISPSYAILSPGQSANFAITLSSQGGASGTVSLQCLDLPSGATCSFNPLAPTLPANGSASDVLTLQTDSSVAAGNYPYTNYSFTVVATMGSLTSTSSLTLLVQAQPAFTGTIIPTTATLSVGQSANFAITLNSQNGATGTVNLQCLNVPSGTTCAFNPTTPTLPANGSASDTLTVQVNSRPAASPPGTRAPWSFPTGWFGTFWLFVITLAAGSVLTMKMWPRRPRLAASVAILIAFALLFFTLASCGGGGGGSPGPAPPSPVSFTITVQANGAGVATTKTIGTLTITVN